MRVHMMYTELMLCVYHVNVTNVRTTGRTRDFADALMVRRAHEIAGVTVASYDVIC